GVDVLTDQRDFAHAGVGQSLDLGDDLHHRSRHLGATRIGHDAKRAELVAAFLHGDERADTARACRLATRRPQDVELILDRKFGVDDRALTFGTGEQTGQAMIALRADDEIDRRRAPDDLLTFGLGDAARNGDGHAAPVARGSGFERADTAELGIDLVRGLLADVAGIKGDEIGVLELCRLGGALGRQHVRHTMGIVDVHLAAEGFDVELARSGHAGGVVLRAQGLNSLMRLVNPAPRAGGRWPGFYPLCRQKQTGVSCPLYYSGARMSASLMAFDHLAISDLT